MNTANSGNLNLDRDFLAERKDLESEKEQILIDLNRVYEELKKLESYILGLKDKENQINQKIANLNKEEKQFVKSLNKEEEAILRRLEEIAEIRAKINWTQEKTRSQVEGVLNDKTEADEKNNPEIYTKKDEENKPEIDGENNEEEKTDEFEGNENTEKTDKREESAKKPLNVDNFLKERLKNYKPETDTKTGEENNEKEKFYTVLDNTWKNDNAEEENEFYENNETKENYSELENIISNKLKEKETILNKLEREESGLVIAWVVYKPWLENGFGYKKLDWGFITFSNFKNWERNWLTYIYKDWILLSVSTFENNSIKESFKYEPETKEFIRMK